MIQLLRRIKDYTNHHVSDITNYVTKCLTMTFKICEWQKLKKEKDNRLEICNRMFKTYILRTKKSRRCDPNPMMIEADTIIKNLRHLIVAMPMSWLKSSDA